MGAQRAHACRIIISLGKILSKQQVIGYILIKAGSYSNRLQACEYERIVNASTGASFSGIFIESPATLSASDRIAVVSRTPGAII